MPKLDKARTSDSINKAGMYILIRTEGLWKGNFWSKINVGAEGLFGTSSRIWLSCFNMMILTEYFSGFSGFLLLFILNFTKNFDTILSIDCENNLIPEIQASTGDLP